MYQTADPGTLTGHVGWRTVPRYFFHAAGGQNFTDGEGTELPNLDAAEEEAVRLHGQILAQTPRPLLRASHCIVTVTDGLRTLFEVKTTVSGPAIVT